MLAVPRRRDPNSGFTIEVSSSSLWILNDLVSSNDKNEFLFKVGGIYRVDALKCCRMMQMNDTRGQKHWRLGCDIAGKT